MDNSVWEVNFNHRDDAVNALMVSLFNISLSRPMLKLVRL